ncbi:hypothetical protein U1Q18_020706 [Sarracenia purpurea var. burkii]
MVDNPRMKNGFQEILMGLESMVDLWNWLRRPIVTQENPLPTACFILGRRTMELFSTRGIGTSKLGWALKERLERLLSLLEETKTWRMLSKTMATEED